MNTTHTIDDLAADARDRLARIPGKPTYLEVLEEMYRGMVRAFRGGFHPDHPADEYVSYPGGYTAELVGQILDEMTEYGRDVYDLALETVELYGPAPEGVDPEAWQVANDRSLDGLDADGEDRVVFDHVADETGVDRDELVAAAAAIR